MATWLVGHEGRSVLGPYRPEEIRARLFGRAWLGWPHREVWQVSAPHELAAIGKVQSEIRRQKAREQDDGDADQRPGGVERQPRAGGYRAS